MHTPVSLNIMDFGAQPGGQAVCTQAFVRAVDAARKAGGGTVYVPAGQYLTGPIQLYSNLRLYLDAGAEILFVQDKDQFPTVSSRWEGVDRPVYMSCIYAENAENICVEGMGTLNGQGAYWWELQRAHTLPFPRPKLISFQSCKRIVIKNVKLTQSPAWTVNPIDCENVLVDGISIDNPANSPNTDGVNPESCNGVRIQGCYISVGDDCVTLKSGTEGAAARIPCQNITVTNCVMAYGHGGVVIGSEMSGDVRNVTISNCVFHKTDRGIRIKTRRGRGGVVEDVRVNNIVMDQVNCPFVINLYYYCGPGGKDKYVWDRSYYPVDARTPAVRRVYFSNITARDIRSCAGFVYGLAEQYVEDLAFDNILVMLGDGFDAEMPAMLDGIEPMTKTGFYLGNVRDASFTNCTITGAQGPAFYAENGEGLVFTNCKAKNCTGDELVKKVNVKD